MFHQAVVAKEGSLSTHDAVFTAAETPSRWNLYAELDKETSTLLKKKLADFVGDPLLRNAPNIVHFLDVEQDTTSNRYTVYTTWCAGGTLEFQARKRFGEQQLCSILVGACRGLYYLNTKLDLLHYDIKPGNIFVHIDGDGVPSGVIGDIDDVIIRSQCVTVRPPIYGTICYGAPFQHCDERRDQVALVLVVSEVLSDVNWFNFCIRQTDPGTTEALRGYATEVPGRDPAYWQCRMYGDYLRTVSHQVVQNANLGKRMRTRKSLSV